MAWQAVLLLAEQQLLAVTRLVLARPAFAMLDRMSTALKLSQVQLALRRLDENSITYVTFAEDVESMDMHDVVLEIDAEGTWQWRRIERNSSKAIASSDGT